VSRVAEREVGSLLIGVGSVVDDIRTSHTKASNPTKPDETGTLRVTYAEQARRVVDNGKSMQNSLYNSIQIAAAASYRQRDMKAMSDYPYNFNAKIVKFDFGKAFYSVVYAPRSVVSQIDFAKSKRLRIDGEINGIRIEAALMPAKGKWYIMVSKKLQKLLGLSVGDTVSVSFDIADQDAITIPTELQYALEANDAARDVWNSWTAGKRRGYCYRVDSAKLPETRECRVEEVIELLMGEAR